MSTTATPNTRTRPNAAARQSAAQKKLAAAAAAAAPKVEAPAPAAAPAPAPAKAGKFLPRTAVAYSANPRTQLRDRLGITWAALNVLELDAAAPAKAALAALEAGTTTEAAIASGEWKYVPAAPAAKVAPAAKAS